MSNKLGLLGLLLIAVVFYQCGDDADIFTLDREFEIQEDQRITINLEGEDSAYIEVQVLDIVDSRCPSNASCVRFGEAVVNIAANGVKENIYNFELCIGDCPQKNQGFKESDTVAAQLDGNNYKIILLDVNPYPFTQNQNESKSALLKVVKG